MKIFHKINTYIKKKLRSAKKNWLSPEEISAVHFFPHIAIFKNLSVKELHYLEKISTQINLAKGEYLFREGESPEEVFIILSGELEVYKSSPLSESEHLIKTLKQGEVVGEISMIDNQPRSASIKAASESSIIRIPFYELKYLNKHKRLFDSLFHEIYQSLTKRLRNSNEIAVLAFEKEIMQFNLRQRMGNFMIYLVTTLCLYSYTLNMLAKLSKESTSASLVTLPLMPLLLIVFLFLMRSTGFTLKNFGLTLNHWRRNVVESVLFTLPVLGIIVFIKWIEIKFYYQDHKLIEPFYAINTNYPAASTHTFQIWLLTLIFYCFVVVPIQELITRGGLQCSLQLYLTGKHPVLTAIILSNLIFSTAHIYLSLLTSLLVFLPGIFFGFLFARHKSLLSPYISHVLVGVWAFWIVGLITY